MRLKLAIGGLHRQGWGYGEFYRLQPMGRYGIGIDSLVAVEMRGWWNLTFGFEDSTLKSLGLGALETMSKRISEKLIAKYA
jgi:hypothetical protein